nr:MAG TPA: zinc-ribbon family protein [Caudoviricetes sp.]
MFNKKEQKVSADEAVKRTARKYIREYPELYYKLKQHMKERNNDWLSAIGAMYSDYYKLKDPEKYAADQERRRQIEARATAQKTRQELDEYNAKSRPNAVQCPYCKSWQTERISTASRVVSIAVVGPASGKIGKQWHCTKCGSNF